MFSHFLLGEYRSFLLGECRSFSKGTVSLLWFQQSWWWVAASLLSKDKVQGTIPLLRLCAERPSRIMNLCKETVRKRQRKIWRKNPNLFPTLLLPLRCSHLSASTLQHFWYFEDLLCTWYLFFTAPQGFSAPCPTELCSEEIPLFWADNHSMFPWAFRRLQSFPNSSKLGLKCVFPPSLCQFTIPTMPGKSCSFSAEHWSALSSSMHGTGRSSRSWDVLSVNKRWTFTRPLCCLQPLASATTSLFLLGAIWLE